MTFHKLLYKYAYGYAHKCQKTFFYIYLKKYIKKHRKFRTINDKEYDILSQLIIDNQISFNDENFILKQSETYIVDYLYKENQRLYLLSRSNYTMDLLIEYHQPYIIENMYSYLHLGLNFDTNFDTQCIKDVIIFSTNLRRVFFNSEITAKSKVQEHWISRLPFFTFCVSCILVMKLIDSIFFSQSYIYIKIVLYLTIYLISIFLVFIRVHQSIIADTKKHMSEVYYKSKKQLYKNFAVETKIDFDLRKQLLYTEKEKIDI